MKKSDVLIIGSGVAGLTTAIRIAESRPELKVTVLSKTELKESNTHYAQGGVAAVWNFERDSFDKHIEDTLDAGDGLCDPEVVKIVVEEGPTRVRELISWGAQFDKDPKGDYQLGREGGHTADRILHYKDLTGAEIQRAIIARARQLDNLELVEQAFAIDLITEHHLGYNITRVTPRITCFGVYVLDKNSLDVETYLAKYTVLATGGAGQIYRNSTNPIVATGDGMAMLYRAKGRIGNMEFVQFHPTALYNPEGENPDFLISEAVRGFGGILRSMDGEAFMDRYDARGSLAPRDIVARAIDKELKERGDDFVCLDCTHLPIEEFKAHFPSIYEKCISRGIDPATDWIPVVPACHYFCGGIQTDAYGKTSIQNLMACGECTFTGLHGANRLASNSLLEGLVFGKRIADFITTHVDGVALRTDIPSWDAFGTTAPKEMVLITQSWKELKDIMSSYVGIVRSDVRLKRALDRLWLLYRETEELYAHTTLSPQLCELRNLITVAYLVTRSASLRKESRGLHYTTDYLEQHHFLESTLL